MEHTTRILFLCTGNSARSQMAEGLARAAAQPTVEIFSAGLEPRGVNPLAKWAMAERGIDISSQTSKDVSAVPKDLDLVITLCDNAADRCPTFPGSAERIHWSLPDPAAVLGSEDERRTAFRTARDEIESRLTILLAERGLTRRS